MALRDEKTIKKIGEQIRKIRESKNITMEELAHNAGIAFSQLGRIERGEINTSVSHVAIIAKALQVKPKEIWDF